MAARLGAAGAAAAAAGVAIGVKTAAQLEQASATLEGLYGNAQLAEQTMQELRKRGEQSPIDTKIWADAAGALAYLGVQGQTAVEMVDNLTVAAEAAGTGSQGVERMTLGLNNLQSTGKATAEVINQISQSGFPLWEELAKRSGQTISQIREDVTAGQVSVEDVMGAIQDASGKTFRRMERAQEDAANTLQNTWARTKDQMQLALADMMTPLLPHLSTAVERFGEFVTFLTENVAPAAERVGSRVAEIVPIGRIRSNLQQATQAFSEFFGGLTGAGRADAFDTSKMLSGVTIPKSEERKLGESFRQALNGAVSNIDTQQLGNRLGQSIVKAIGWIARNIGKVTDAIISALSQVDWAKVGREIVPSALGFVIGVVDALLDPTVWIKVIRENWDTLLLLVLGIMFAPARFIRPLVKMLRKIPFVGRFLGWLVESLNKVGKRILGAIGSFFQTMFRAFTRQLGVRGPRFLKSFGKWLSELPTRVGVWAITLVESAKRMMSRFADRLGRGAADALRWTLRKIGDGFRALWRWISGTAVGRMLRRGREIISGMLKGISNAMKGIGRWLKKNVVDPVINAVKNFFGIGSPSKVFSAIGGDLIRGLLRGLSQTSGGDIARKIFGDMPSALGSLVNKGLVSIKNLPGKAMRALGNLGGGILDKLGFGGGGSNSANVALGKQMAAAMGWTGGQWQALKTLWHNESGWSNTAQNPTSSAFGIAQFLDSTWRSMGVAKTSNPATQISAGLKYIAQRYGSPAAALRFWQSQSPHWYDQGGVATGAGFVPKSTLKPERMLSPRQTVAFDRLVDRLDDRGDGQMQVVGGRLELTRDSRGQLEAFVRDVTVQEIGDDTAFRSRRGARA